MLGSQNCWEIKILLSTPSQLSADCGLFIFLMEPEESMSKPNCAEVFIKGTRRASHMLPAMVCETPWWSRYIN